MTNKSNNHGRAYEYAVLKNLAQLSRHYRPVQVIENRSLLVAKRDYESLSSSEQNTYDISAEAAVRVVLDFEPMLTERSDDSLTLSIQQDQAGISGDVRDIIAIRQAEKWEIGLSIKHNHQAVKHSRLSGTIDFGKEWYGEPCSQAYWDKVSPIFHRLAAERAAGKNWQDLPDKVDGIYRPLLGAFVDEVLRAYGEDSTVATKIAEYLLGRFDFYKVISIDSKQITLVQAFNLRGTLNKSSKDVSPKIQAPVSPLPTEIINMRFSSARPDNTIELYMDNGWQFSLRIHSAATKVEKSLKFDVQLIGRPASIVEISAKWL